MKNEQISKIVIKDEEEVKKERLNKRFHNTIENLRQALYGLLIIEQAKDLRGKAILPLENDSEIYIEIRKKQGETNE